MKYNFKSYALAFAFIVCGMTTLQINAQQSENFVENGSFEQTDGKIKKLGAIESALGWISPTGYSFRIS
ncbi:MAG: hypothetical protein HYR91_09530 [Flavobacteriia bacterium]|nr:hypothetical protein [Flavobacteriia bacterium]